MWNRKRHSFRIVRAQDDSPSPVDEANNESAEIAQQPVRLETVSLREFLKQICRGHAADFLRNQIRLELDVPFGMTLLADPSWLQIALDLLIEKSVRRMDGGGDLYITAVASDRYLELEFCDSSDRMFHDFRVPNSVTEKAAATTNAEPSREERAEFDALMSIVRMHRGTIKQMKCPQGGLAWNMRFPRQQQRRAAA